MDISQKISIENVKNAKYFFNCWIYAVFDQSGGISMRIEK